RHFSWLQPLQPHEQLWLVLEQSAVTAATLNDSGLELVAVARAHHECEISSRVRRSNQLALAVAAVKSGQGFPQVALEVRCRTFLRQPTWHIDRANRCLEVSGLLVGMGEMPLEIYVRIGDQNVLYASVRADQPCSPFSFQSEVPVATMGDEM